MKNKTIKFLSTTLLSAGLVLSLSACGDATPAPAANTPAPAPAPTQVAETPAADDTPAVSYDDVHEDLLYVLRVVSENLETFDNPWDQIMLADDVPSPEMKYGLLVVPFFPSDNVARNTRTVSISNGNFFVEIVSANTGAVWHINQDGVITEGN